MRTVFRNSEIPGRIHALQPFLSVGKLPDGTRTWSGHSGPAASFGHAPRRFHAWLRQAVYVVYSYDTPIAWVTENEPEDPDPYHYSVPNVSYSPTTSQHQYAVLEAWAEARRRQGCGRWELDGQRQVVRVPSTAETYGVPRRPRSGGLDGVRPGEVVGRASAYSGVGDDASHWSPHGGRAWGPVGSDRSEYRHPAHP